MSAAEQHYVMMALEAADYRVNELTTQNERLLNCLSSCADVISPKHYPNLVMEIEDLLKAAGREI